MHRMTPSSFGFLSPRASFFCSLEFSCTQPTKTLCILSESHQLGVQLGNSRPVLILKKKGFGLKRADPVLEVILHSSLPAVVGELPWFKFFSCF